MLGSPVKDETWPSRRVWTLPLKTCKSYCVPVTGCMIFWLYIWWLHNIYQQNKAPSFHQMTLVLWTIWVHFFMGPCFHGPVNLIQKTPSTWLTIPEEIIVWYMGDQVKSDQYWTFKSFLAQGLLHSFLYHQILWILTGFFLQSVVEGFIFIQINSRLSHLERQALIRVWREHDSWSLAQRTNIYVWILPTITTLRQPNHCVMFSW